VHQEFKLRLRLFQRTRRGCGVKRQWTALIRSMETSIAENIFRTLALAGIVALVLLLGWNEPLKYRFMSRADIYALENPPQAAPGSDTTWMWDKSRQGKLDRSPYNRSSSSSSGYFGR
jgi:hypothetical protein